MKDSINIGQEIREELRRIDRSATWFSHYWSCTGRNVAAYAYALTLYPTYSPDDGTNQYVYRYQGNAVRLIRDAN